VLIFCLCELAIYILFRTIDELEGHSFSYEDTIMDSIQEVKSMRILHAGNNNAHQSTQITMHQLMY